MRTIQAIPYKLRMVLAACLLGLVSGFAGIILHDLLEFVEGLVFGHSEHESSFLTDGVPPYRIGISLLIVFFATKGEASLHQGADEGGKFPSRPSFLETIAPF